MVIVKSINEAITPRFACHHDHEIDLPKECCLNDGMQNPPGYNCSIVGVKYSIFSAIKREIVVNVNPFFGDKVTCSVPCSSGCMPSDLMDFLQPIAT